MRKLRQLAPELFWGGLVAVWALLLGAQSAGQTDGKELAGNLGIGLGGVALLIRALTPLLRPHTAGSSVDREDVRWQERTSASIETLALSIRDWAEEQRRHNQQVELLMRQSIIPRIGDPT